MQALLDPRLWLAALMLLIAAAAGGYWKGAKDTRAEAAVALLQTVEQARRTEHALQEKADGIRIEGEAARRRIAGERDAALRELRERPARLPENSLATGRCNGATGRELARPDAEFLARYAADRAEEARRLRTCQAWIKALTAPK